MNQVLVPSEPRRTALGLRWKLGGGLLAVALTAAAAVSVASAAAGDGGVIHSCVTPGGALKVLALSAACAGNDRALDWNVQGPPGPTGPVGPAGSPGAVGPQGPAG